MMLDREFSTENHRTRSTSWVEHDVEETMFFGKSWDAVSLSLTAGCLDRQEVVLPSSSSNSKVTPREAATTNVTTEAPAEAARFVLWGNA